MASEGQHPDDLRGLERELRALVPRGPNIDVARLMYRAGQASLSPVPAPLPAAPVPFWRAQWMWPVSTAVASTVAAWLAVMLVLSHNTDALPQPAPRVVVPPHPPVVRPPSVAASTVASPAPVVIVGETPVATFHAADAHYLRDRETALSQGVEALPAPPGGSQPRTEATYHTMNRSVGAELGTVRSSSTSIWSSLFGF